MQDMQINTIKPKVKYYAGHANMQRHPKPVRKRTNGNRMQIEGEMLLIQTQRCPQSSAN
jgi:hypothetical protein